MEQTKKAAYIMKSPIFLTSILLCVMTLSQPIHAAESDAYFLAKEAYKKNDCVSTIKLLREYLKSTKPDKEKLTSVYAVIGWCETYLNHGQATYSINGHDGADEEITVDTEFGEWMKSNPIQLF